MLDGGRARSRTAPASPSVSSSPSAQVKPELVGRLGRSAVLVARLALALGGVRDAPAPPTTGRCPRSSLWRIPAVDVTGGDHGLLIRLVGVEDGFRVVRHAARQPPLMPRRRCPLALPLAFRRQRNSEMERRALPNSVERREACSGMSGVSCTAANVSISSVRDASHRTRCALSEGPGAGHHRGGVGRSWHQRVVDLFGIPVSLDALLKEPPAPATPRGCRAATASRADRPRRRRRRH